MRLGGGSAADDPGEGFGGGTEAGLAAMVVIWGVNFAVAKRALDAFEPLTFNALRYPLASLFVYAVLRSRGPLRRPLREDVPRIVLLGLTGNTVYQLAFILGLDLTRAGNASLMLALAPVFIALLGAWRGGERHGARGWGGVLLSLVGVALVSGSALRLEGTRSLVGDLILVSAAAVWALYTVGARPLIERYGALDTTAWTLWVGAAGIVLCGLPSLARQEWGTVAPGAWGGLLYSAFLSIGLAYLLWYRGVERLGSTRTAVYSNLTPVVALAAGALWVGEQPTALSLSGAALTLLGILLVRSG